ncbi:DUF2169 domain-containing protein [Polyangium spumosum]|uniref:DUF2169 domain-containing protein n=1 Tax=Polyangium spumosum TaxID=889282 RepID=UPI00129A47BF
MNTIKPQRIGLLTRAFENENVCHFSIALLVFFPFESPRRILSEVDLWKFVAAELGKDGILDECMPKPNGEIVVNGRCFAPGGVPRAASSVRVKLGAVDKTLYVVGDRVWKRGVPSEPQPFTEMPITWETAFGGPDFPDNPLGKGASPVRTEAGEVHPMPNVEYPGKLLQSPRERPAPASFGPIDLTWPQRFSKVGTYDEAWLKELFPGFAEDLEPGFFSTAPADQQIEGFFRGDEAFVIENMHPSKPRIESALPGVAARCFVRRETPSGEVFREIPMRIDTVRLFPHAERGVVVFRGITRVREDDAADVKQICCALEAMGAPKPVSYYEAVIAKRSDKKKGHLFALRDADLMPEPGPDEGAPKAEPSDDDELTGGEGLLLANLRKKAEAELEKAKEQMRAAGIDPEGRLPAIPPATPPPKPEELPEVIEAAMEIAEKQMAAEKERRAAAEAEARKACEEAGVDYEAMLKKAQADAAGPPKFSAKRELARLQDLAQLYRNAGMPDVGLEQKIADPELEKKLLAAEENLRDNYRKFAHHMPAAAAMPGDGSAAAREALREGRAKGEGFAGRDLTGADLSGLDLAGLDFRGAMLECANLSGSRLEGADLSGAVLARANLTDARLGGAKLVGTNLGGANLTRVEASGVDFTGAVLACADLRGARLRGANLTKADLSEAIYGDTDTREIQAAGTNFIKSDLRGAGFAGAVLERCVFIESNVSGVDFSGAKLVSAVFVEAKGEGAVLRGANLENLRVVKDSSFVGADFRGASLPRANFRGALLEGADFTEADLTGADFSGADLRGGRLERVLAKESMWIRTDLTGADLRRGNFMFAVLQKARIAGADLRGANLFRSDMAKVHLDGATNVKGAHVVEARVVKNRATDDPG